MQSPPIMPQAQSNTVNPSAQRMRRTNEKHRSFHLKQQLFPSLDSRKSSGRRLGKVGKGHLGQERPAHEVHAPNVHVHGEVPVSVFAVQDGAVVHKPADSR